MQSADLPCHENDAISSSSRVSGITKSYCASSRVVFSTLAVGCFHLAEQTVITGFKFAPYPREASFAVGESTVSAQFKGLIC